MLDDWAALLQQLDGVTLELELDAAERERGFQFLQRRRVDGDARVLLVVTV